MPGVQKERIMTKRREVSRLLLANSPGILVCVLILGWIGYAYWEEHHVPRCEYIDG
jgi:hypothetical protein